MSLDLLRYEVKGNKLFRTDGVLIEEPTIAYDSDGGLLKAGEYELVEDYYSRLFRELGSVNREYTRTLKLARYCSESLLTLKEFCTIMNFGLLCSVNGGRIESIIKCENGVESAKEEIRKLQEAGY